jgi:hypothetical protein
MRVLDASAHLSHMSVTFGPAITEVDIVGYRLTCACGTARTRGPVASEYGLATAMVDTDATPACGDEYCSTDRGHAEAVFVFGEAPEVNMSNMNARFVLETLGVIDEDLWGQESGERFLGRILTALAVAPDDEGVPAHDMFLTEAPETGARIVNCGRDEGYLQARLSQLHDVAEWCQANGRDVVWS